MKFLINRIFIIGCFLLLTACGSTNHGDSSGQQSELTNQDNQMEELGEEENDNNAKSEEAELPQNEEIVIENEVFKIFSPQPNEVFTEQIEVRGLAQVFEGTIQYEFEDGHFILDKGFVTASEGGPQWGTFSITIPIDEAIAGEHKVILYEESAKDGSRIHELIIPVQVEK